MEITWKDVWKTVEDTYGYDSEEDIEEDHVLWDVNLIEAFVRKHEAHIKNIRMIRSLINDFK